MCIERLALESGLVIGIPVCPPFPGTATVWQAAGLSGDCSLSFEQLLPFDQHHYGGTEAVDAAVLAVGAAAGDKVRSRSCLLTADVFNHMRWCHAIPLTRRIGCA